jgi:Subtilase family.
MFKKMTTRIISIIMTVILFSTILPMSIFAVDEFASTPSALEYGTTEIIIKYKDDVSESKREKAKTNAGKKSNRKKKTKIKKREFLQSVEAEVVDVEKAEDVAVTVEALNEQADVEYAMPNYGLEIYEAEDEAFEQAEQSVLPPSASNYEMYMQKATNGLGGNILIGIIDTGIDISNPEIAPHIWTNSTEIPNNGIDDDKNGYVDDVHGWNFLDDNNQVFTNMDTDAHGTKIAAAMIKNLPEGAKIVPIKFMSNTSGSTAEALSAI